MTLSGINRQTAVNIVSYRRQIGTFRLVEDLALVSGIGATRLEDLRYEICVSDRARTCHDSPSGSQSELDATGHGIGSCRSHHRSGSRSKVNVNSANIFQLMKIKFITQAIAENIVMYRETKGPFTNLDDLTRVKGIKPSLLSSIRPYLVLRDGCRSNNLVNSTTENGDIAKIKRSCADECPITSPLKLGSIRVKRSPTEPLLNSVLRFATWGLDRCGLDKVENPGVQDIIAMTILENGIKLLAVQDIGCSLVLQKLCDGLNVPSLYNVRMWPHRRGSWKSVSPTVNAGKEWLSTVGFMFNADFGLKPVNVTRFVTCFDKETGQSALCFVVDFEVNGLEISFANFSFLSSRVKDPDFWSWKDLVKDLQCPNSDTCLIFSGDCTSIGNFQGEVMKVFEEAGFHATVMIDQFTDISHNNPNGSKCSENIWLNRQTQSLFNGHSMVIRDGLSSPWIPNGWQWGGLVSSRCPVLVDLELKGKSVDKFTS